jgi:hypothetical protein
MQTETLRVRGSGARALFAGDLRRHRRLQVALAGRFMREDRQESDCTIKDISVGGAAVVCVVRPNVGERLIAYFEHIGGVEGIVTRHTSDGFAFQFKSSEHKRNKLAAQLTILINRVDFPEAESRAGMRVSAGAKRAVLRFEDGVTVDVSLIDISETGVAVETPARPALGATVFIANLPAVVRRHTDQGLGLQFEAPMTLDAVKAHFA